MQVRTPPPPSVTLLDRSRHFFCSMLMPFSAWAGPAFSATSQLLYHKGKWISPTLRAFIDFTLQRFQVSQK
ncbi:MAG: hypothetical protein KAZ05_01080 [Negativicutes bacterium]|nr:hypothetical protein [Negativicutes bacterium]